MKQLRLSILLFILGTMLLSFCHLATGIGARQTIYNSQSQEKNNSKKSAKTLDSGSADYTMYFGA